MDSTLLKATQLRISVIRVAVSFLTVIIFLSCDLVANQQLRGNSDVEKAHILQWMSFADGEILPLSCTIVFPVLGIIQYNKQVGYEHFKHLFIVKKFLTFMS